MTDRVERLRAAFAAGNSGDRRTAMKDFHQDYVHHSNLFGDLQGLDNYFATWMPAVEAAQVKQEVIDVVEHGPFVLVTVMQSSLMSDEPIHGVHLYRWKDDEIVELWSISNPG